MESNINIDQELPKDKNSTEQDSALARPSTQYSTELDEDDDFALLRLKLIQGISEEVSNGEARPGDFFIDGLGVVEPPFTIIPMLLGRQRVFRPDDSEINPEDEIMCFSADGKTGIGEPGGQCNVCPNSQFQGRTPPLCVDIRNYICFDPTREVLLKWSLSRSAISVAKEINTFIKTKKIGNFAIQISSFETGQAKRKYYKPKIRAVPIPDGITLPEMI